MIYSKTAVYTFLVSSALMQRVLKKKKSHFSLLKNNLNYIIIFF